MDDQVLRILGGTNHERPKKMVIKQFLSWPNSKDQWCCWDEDWRAPCKPGSSLAWPEWSIEHSKIYSETHPSPSLVSWPGLWFSGRRKWLMFNEVWKMQIIWSKKRGSFRDWECLFQKSNLIILLSKRNNLRSRRT